MMKERILFIDMDGVLADFEGGLEKGTGDLNDMFEEGFFNTLETMEDNISENVEKIQKLVKVKILSKACVSSDDVKYYGQVADKLRWLERFVPSVESQDVIIQSVDESKGEIIERYKEFDCLLLDDYSLNLAEWELAGGIGIKKAKRFRQHRTFEQVHGLRDLIILLENVL